ncbi:hypothetical protein [Aquabacterium sp.]|uniref:hypothetical protein n=1 Tax=Aquabacterium sp. TaxID=1872578 RepID=UPI003783F9C9
MTDTTTSPRPDTPTGTPPGTISWHDEQVLLGVRVRAFFFDPQLVDARGDWVARLLPVLSPALPMPQSLHHDGERGSYKVGDLQALPDAVLVHGNGVLCVSHRHADKLPHDPERWVRQLRIDLMLQAIVTAMAVSGQRQQPTVALLRCHNALYQFDPGPPVLECLATSIGAAKRYAGVSGSITPQQLAAFCEPRLRELQAPPGDAAAPRTQCDSNPFADTTPSDEASVGA